MNKLSNEENILIKVQGLYTFTVSLAGVFVNIFLFKIGNFQSIILYGLVTFIFLLFWYITSGWTLKKFSSRTLLCFGLFCLSINYGLLFILREQSINFLIPLGIISGTGLGNFWAGFNISQYVLTHKETRSEYFGQSGSLLSLGQSFGPAIGGGIILLATVLALPIVYGYAVLFLFVTLLTILNIFLSTNLPVFTGIDFSLKHILNHKRTRNWKLVLLQQFFMGIWDVGFGNVSGILLFLILKGEFTVGVVNTLSALVYAGACLLAGKLLTHEKRYLYFGMIGLPLGILLFAFQQNWIGVLSLIIITGFCAPFINIPSSIAYYDTVDNINELWQKNYHFLIERDTALGVPRMLNYLFLLLFFTGGDQVLLAKQWIKIVPIFPVIIGILLFLMDKPKKESSSSLPLN